MLSMRLPVFLLMALVVLLPACSAPAATPPAAASIPTPVAAVPGVAVASAEVVPAQVSRLAFPVSGPLKEVTVKAGQRVSAGQRLAVLDLPDLIGAVSQAEAAVQAAQKDYEFYRVPRRQPPVLVNPRKPWHGLTAGPLEPPERLQLAEAQLAAAQAVLESARALAAQAVLTAPFEGVVTAVEASPGEVVNAGQVVLVLANLDAWQVETTDLGERYLASIRPGQTVRVYVDALERDFSGQVVRIAPRANKEGGDVYFRVTISLDEPSPGILWGMSAEVKFQAQ